MKKILPALLLFVAAGAALWFGVLRPDGNSPATAAADEEGTRYDFEAQGVLLRQMDEKGRLRYEVEADRILQMPDRGQVLATGLILRHDPPGTTPGGPNRWTLRADEGELPADGRVFTLKGAVQADGTPQKRSTPLRVTTSQLSIDLEEQQVFTDEEVQMAFGCSRVRGRALRANIATGEVALESSIHGTICP
jgi:LPS export ABC transporter protein LptC